MAHRCGLCCLREGNACKKRGQANAIECAKNAIVNVVVGGFGCVAGEKRHGDPQKCCENTKSSQPIVSLP